MPMMRKRITTATLLNGVLLMQDNINNVFIFLQKYLKNLDFLLILAYQTTYKLKNTNSDLIYN
jgi:hypothetical protein